MLNKFKKIFSLNNKKNKMLDVNIKDGNIEAKIDLSPSNYFDAIKGNRFKVTDEELDKYYETCKVLLDKYGDMGQKRGFNKLTHLISCIDKERKIINEGVEYFVYRDDVFEYIEDVSKKVVKITELKNYMRDIPTDVVEKYKSVEEYFDEFYVLYTDFTGKEERKFEVKSRDDKDPILFGVFKEEIDEMNFINDRMYVIADWIDEYCDLTLEKMITEFKKVKGRKDVALPVKTV